MKNHIITRRTKLFMTMLLLITTSAVHGVMVGNGRFDVLIEKAQIIIKGRIAQIDQPAFEDINFKVDVIDILKTDGGEIPNHLDFESPLPLWPDEFGIPYVRGQYVLLVLQRASGTICIENNQGAILPATSDKLKHDANSPQTRKIFEELQACLGQTKDQKAKGLVLVYMSQLGTYKDENIFLPYLKSDNEWLRRGALASLIRINPAPDLINEAAADFTMHLSEPSDELLFWKMYVNVQWSARCGSFGMDKVLTTRAQAYLPIYRVLIDKAPSDYRHVYIAVDALKNVGTPEDIPRLYKYINDEKAWMRHDVLEGIGRILE